MNKRPRIKYAVVGTIVHRFEVISNPAERNGMDVYDCFNGRRLPSELVPKRMHCTIEGAIDYAVEKRRKEMDAKRIFPEKSRSELYTLEGMVISLLETKRRLCHS